MENWNNFAKRFALSDKQQGQFKEYLDLLKQENEKFNLTAIIDDNDIINYHFEDSLNLENFVDLNNVNSICDIGTGAGFPGLPLKIKYPHMHVILIEVNNKKREFLQDVIDKLCLENVILYPNDWRTFLRTTSYQIDLFLARASLHTDELVRIFKPNSSYKNSILIYWASLTWQPTNKEIPFLNKQELYNVGNKQRKLIFFSI